VIVDSITTVVPTPAQNSAPRPCTELHRMSAPMQSTAHCMAHTAQKSSPNGDYCSRRLRARDSAFGRVRPESQGIAIRLRRDGGEASSSVQRTAMNGYATATNQWHTYKYAKYMPPKASRRYPRRLRRM
jgi:hypothetical protein